MAVNLLSVTVKNYGGSEYTQTTLLNKGRIRTAMANGSDCQLLYDDRFDIAENVIDVLVDDTYATIKAATITTNNYTYGKRFEVTNITQIDANEYETALSMVLSVDAIIRAYANPAAPSTDSIIEYTNPQTNYRQKIYTTTTLADLVTNSTT